METEKIELGDGKYTLVLEDNDRKFYALRYGEEWRDLIGDNLIFEMFYKIKELEEIKWMYEELKK